MYLLKSRERFVENKGDIVEKEIDELDKEIKIDPSFCPQVLAIDRIGPYALDDLENLVPDVKLVVKLSMGTSALTLIVKLHQRVEKVLVGELVPVQSIPKYTFLVAADFPNTMEKDGDKTRLEVWVLDIFGAPKEDDTNHHQLFGLGRCNNEWHLACDKFKVVHNVFKEVLREAFECCRLLLG